MYQFNFNLFIVVFAVLFVHELDAVYRHEWRMLPLLKKLSDQKAFIIFAAGLHLPILALILFFFANLHAISNPKLIYAGIDIALAAHTAVHFLCRKHKKNEFNNPFSKIVIYLTGMLALIHFILTLIAIY